MDAASLVSLEDPANNFTAAEGKNEMVVLPCATIDTNRSNGGKVMK